MDKGKIHMMGIGGSGMSAVAHVASEAGYEVTGCDIEKVSAYGKNYTVGHSKSHVNDADLVVVSPAVFFQDRENEEIMEARNQKKLTTWQEFTGKTLTKGKKVIAIAGTHGKSTTTAMAGKLLEDANLDPTVILGAKVPAWGGNGRFGKGEYFIIEADEFNDNFLNYTPEIIIVNNIEFDHPDYFKDEKQVFDSFKRFIAKLTGVKVLIINKDSQGNRKLLESINKKGIKIITYSASSEKIDFSLSVPGRHNIENALGVIKLGEVLGIKQAVIEKSLKSFYGIGRRMELVAKRSGIEIYDDYAHHPTAIAATLEALRDSHPKSRIWTIVEPHGYARTKALLANYKSAFDLADKVIIGPIFQSRDKKDPGLTPAKVAIASGANAVGFDSFEEIKKTLSREVKKGDVIIIMGAGKSYLWAKEIAGLFPATFADLTTFGIGGGIGKLLEVKTKEELIEAVKTAKRQNLPIFILGGGSDILVGDEGFSGVVIKFTGNKIKFEDSKVTAEAGLIWDDMVEEAVLRNLQGIECLSGIPGTVGAAPIQNIGAYGQELKDTFVSLTAYDIKKEKFVEFNNIDCGFGYRESVFKRPEYWQKYVIIDITLKLNKNKKPDVKYDSLKTFLNDRKITDPSLSSVREAVLTVRAGKFENPKEAGNAGSFFKNPVIDEKKAKSLTEKYPNIPLRAQPDGLYKGSAGWFIEQAGWKGRRHKNAAVSGKHALILTNPEGKATAKEIIELSDIIIADVKKKFGITLEREVQLINFNQNKNKPDSNKNKKGDNKFKDKKVAVLGLGIEGTDAVSFLLSQGADITVFDKKEEKELDFGSIDKWKIKISSGKNYLKEGLLGFDYIVRSPGVYRFLPEIIKAEKSGVTVTSPIKIFFEQCPGSIIGVTGTKGKGTTSTLIYEILKAGGRDVFLSGNIGKPYLKLLPLLSNESFVVLEMSSFQLIDLSTSPHIAVVLNITLDHMDWHKDVKEYVDAKKNIVSHQKTGDFAVINEDYDTPKSFAANLKSKIIFFSGKKLDRKYREKLLLRGEHNLENIAAAVEVAKVLRLPDPVIQKVVSSFKGLEHRLELVAEVSGRTFYNDSFATGPQPTMAAIKSFTEPITLIVGGSDKGLDYSELRSEIALHPNVKTLILIGEMGEAIAGGIKGKNIIKLGSAPMDAIVKKAFETTPEGDVIILSPAAASFDMFKNYKDRGNQFKNSVLKLA